MCLPNSVPSVTNDSQRVKFGKFLVGVLLIGLILLCYGAGAILLVEQLVTEINSMPPVDMGVSLAGLR